MQGNSDAHERNLSLVFTRLKLLSVFHSASNGFLFSTCIIILIKFFGLHLCKWIAPLSQAMCLAAGPVCSNCALQQPAGAVAKHRDGQPGCYGRVKSLHIAVYPGEQLHGQPAKAGGAGG